MGFRSYYPQYFYLPGWAGGGSLRILSAPLLG
jgi:hypothetical protein